MSTDLPKVLSQLQTFIRVFTYKIVARSKWHRYGTKLCDCHPMYMYNKIRFDIEHLNSFYGKLKVYM